MPNIEKLIIPKEILDSPIDEEEKKYLEEINWQEFVSFTKKEAINKSPEELQQISNDMLKKSKQISIKIPYVLLNEIKQKAKQEGLPYQTYIKHILHKEVFK